MITHWSTLRDWIDESRASETGTAAGSSVTPMTGGATDAIRASCTGGASSPMPWSLRRKHEYELSQNAVRFLAAGRRRRLLGLLGLGHRGRRGAGRRRLARHDPGQEAWLKHEAEALSPAVRLAGGPAIVGPGDRRVTFPSLLVDRHEVSNQQYRYCVQALRCAPAG